MSASSVENQISRINTLSIKMFGLQQKSQDIQKKIKIQKHMAYLREKKINRRCPWERPDINILYKYFKSMLLKMLKNNEIDKKQK